MNLLKRIHWLIFLLVAVFTAYGEEPAIPALKWPWFELSTPHFEVRCCGREWQARNLAIQLEQFHDAYAELAGKQAVASPPIPVLAFANQAALTPFLWMVNGKPANVAGFFQRRRDENLIVISFTDANTASLSVIFHEYAHMLLRRNENVWPAWLQEGMAEMYSTFRVSGKRIEIGHPIARHLRTLANGGLLPIEALMQVDHNSPSYNERDQQGMFYAESWLLAHYLINGGDPALGMAINRFTDLLRDGHPVLEAFTNATGLTLGEMDARLARYASNRKYPPLVLTLSNALPELGFLPTHAQPQVETAYYLGKLLLMSKREPEAEKMFRRALEIAPESNLPYEGLGFLAAQRTNHSEASELFKQAMEKNPKDYLAHAVYAREQLIIYTHNEGPEPKIPSDVSQELATELRKSISLMPDYAQSYFLLGLVLFSSGENQEDAEKNFSKAAELQPEDLYIQLYLAETKYRLNKRDEAAILLKTVQNRAQDKAVKDEADRLMRKIQQ